MIQGENDTILPPSITENYRLQIPESSDSNDDISELNHTLYSVENSFIISNFPRRLIKKGTNSQSGTQFEASISCNFTGNKVEVNVIDIKSFLVNEFDGHLQRVPIESKLESSGRQMWIVKNMKIKSTETRRSSRHRISDKSVILFVVNAEVKMSNRKVPLIKNLHSETVVVIVHSNQESDAQLSLFVDDYFRTDRLSFIEGRGFPFSPHSSCEHLVNSISKYFAKETNRGLTFDNCEYLVYKMKGLFQSENVLINDFIKKPMNSTKLSVGQWIMLVVRMFKNDHIKNLWLHGLIEGFISKDVGHILHDSGSFLLRFSERQAAIGVVMRTESNEINAWDPFTEVECRKTNLANHLCDFPGLKTLRKADGTHVFKELALLDFLDTKEVDDGYTPRGCILINQESNISDGTPRIDDMDSMVGDDPLDCSSNDMAIDQESNIGDDLDLDELHTICEGLLGR